MDNKFLAGVGCLLLVASVTPTVVGHDQRAAFGGMADGVSGRFAGAAGPAIADETVPQDTIATGAILCVMEVAGDGTMPFPQDEIHVGDYTAGDDTGFPSPPFNILPDTWDDGGTGGACHTDSFDFDAYNSPGCPAAYAHAADALTAEAGGDGDTWIAASCDWGSINGGSPPQSDRVFTCVFNAILTGHPEYIISPGNPPPPREGCVQDYLRCLLTITPEECNENGVFTCGSDGNSDAANFGHGLQGVAYPSAAFLASGCPVSTATAATFVWEAVNVVDGHPHLHPVVSGEVWQTATASTPPLSTCTGAVIPIDGGTNAGGTTLTCIGVCTTAGIKTHATKATGPFVAAVRTTVTGCANGAAIDPGAPMTGPYPTAAGTYECSIHADQGTTGSGRCEPTTFP